MLTVVFLFNFLVINVYSQDKPKMTPEERAKKITTELQTVLNLSDEQYNQAYTAYYNHFTKVKELRNSGDDADKKGKIKSYRKDLRTEMKSILTDEQAEKLKSYLKEKKANRKEKKKNKVR